MYYPEWVRCLVRPRLDIPDGRRTEESYHQPSDFDWDITRDTSNVSDIPFFFQVTQYAGAPSLSGRSSIEPSPLFPVAQPIDTYTTRHPHYPFSPTTRVKRRPSDTMDHRMTGSWRGWERLTLNVHRCLGHRTTQFTILHGYPVSA